MTLLASNDLARRIVHMPMPVETPRNKRKLRREFRRKGYRAVYLEVSGYPPGKRELAHEWLREQERASDRRKRWPFSLIIVLATATAVVAAYLAAVQLRWL
jgi:hypothetical protein